MHVSTIRLMCLIVFGILVSLPDHAVARSRHGRCRGEGVSAAGSPAILAFVRNVGQSKSIQTTSVNGQDKNGIDQSPISLPNTGSVTLSDNDGTLKFHVKVNLMYPTTQLPFNSMYASVFSDAAPEFPTGSPLTLNLESSTSSTATFSFTQLVGFDTHKIAIWAKYTDSVGETALSRTIGTLIVNRIP